MPNPLANITPEERAENLAKARLARIDKKEWAEKNLRLEYADEAFHRELASKYRVKLPVRYDKAHSKFVNRVLKALGLSKEWYTLHSGFKNGREEAEANPTMNAVQQIGLILEVYDEEMK